MVLFGTLFHGKYSQRDKVLALKLAEPSEKRVVYQVLRVWFDLSAGVRRAALVQ